jgi:hypothetical protein
VLQVWLVAASQDDDKGAVAAAVDMIGETVKEVGADGLGPTHCDALAAVVHALFKGEAACQVSRIDRDLLYLRPKIDHPNIYCAPPSSRFF